MSEKNIIQVSELRNIDKSKNYLIEKRKQDELKSEKHKKLLTNLNYTEHLHVLASTITGCVSISVFASLFGIPVDIESFSVGINLYAITAAIKKI